MKRKMTALLTVVLMLTMLAGCGANGAASKNEIAFSELFKDDVIMYGCGKVDKDASVSISVYKTDGSYVYYAIDSSLGKYAQESDSDIFSSLETENVYAYGEYKLGVETDSTGNNTESETILRRYRFGDGSGSDWSFGSGSYVSFEGHMTIYDSSYMVFKGKKDGYMLIRDTDKTKDKTVYFDPVGTDGIAVDKDARAVFGEAE